MLIPKSILLGVAGLLPAIVSGNLESGQQITFMPSPSSPSISEKPHPNLKISNTNRNGVDC
ncbi:hypothetical protein PGTUg99_010780 [Puccinia graminis f. sp. tritici]|uniref:Uncharacterized protein n=1 Tax=Puccinia graminis f. sp. tritici TaxID=56615 RepID=A0A5B0N1T0_PUCGR|nr:hypothetical protein PGTUg99_010780 [Puccinia graminis f. sp. tritici]